VQENKGAGNSRFFRRCKRSVKAKEKEAVSSDCERAGSNKSLQVIENH
jgi:hypothetical protein